MQKAEKETQMYRTDSVGKGEGGIFRENNIKTCILSRTKEITSPGWMEKTLESPLDCKEIQPVHPKGDQSWMFIGKTDAEAETPVLWPPHAKS